MARWPHLCAAMLIAASPVAFGEEIRHIEPKSYPVFSGESGDTAKLARLKRGSSAMPSPILIDQVATIADDGSVRMGCGHRGVRDFRDIAVRGSTQ